MRNAWAYVGLTLSHVVEYLTASAEVQRGIDKEWSMSLLIRRYKLATGMIQEERIDEPDRIARYFKLFEKEDVKKLQTGVKVIIEKDEWQLLP